MNKRMPEDVHVGLMAKRHLFSGSSYTVVRGEQLVPIHFTVAYFVVCFFVAFLFLDCVLFGTGIKFFISFAMQTAL